MRITKTDFSTDKEGNLMIDFLMSVASLFFFFFSCGFLTKAGNEDISLVQYRMLLGNLFGLFHYQHSMDF